MNSVIAIVGRPNVGKSTLFNRLTRSNDAIVANYPGLTRDRQYGRGKIGHDGYWVIDTGGLMDETHDVALLMMKQAELAIDEADAIMLVVDAREGLTAVDDEITQFLRTKNKPVYLVVNKIDGVDEQIILADFHRLGVGEPYPISASHGRGVTQTMELILSDLPGSEGIVANTEELGISVAIIGRPNVGKSTLINRMLGEERVLTFDAPGTTRDSIYIPFEKDEQRYTLIDTAGIRRRGKVYEAVEKFSVIKALQAISEANVVIALIDASEGLTEQDMTLLGQVLQQGRALVFAVNKWDGLSSEKRDKVKADIERRLDFINFAKIYFISALHGSGVGLLFDAVAQAYQSAMSDMATAKLTSLLEAAVEKHQPPLVKGRRIKLRYAHQGGKNPPLIVIHGNQTNRLPDSYRRYLAHHYQKQLKLVGTPVQIELRTSDNPYKSKKNKLTPRQAYKKKRLMKHIKKNKKS